jgi:DNA invertase Pin-like site-specific DNA recombinase
MRDIQQGPIPAAQYLRMSTEHQRYSIRNQARAISAYAAQHGFKIIRTYSDPGESGLTLRERPGLQALLADVVKPTRDFDRVLVLDVSRWGRFQNLDQGGHYEFICFEAGAPIVYCAEPFDNDGTPMMSLLKQIKRLQAAEYSRELSSKISQAILLQAKVGHKLGGPRRYGFDRILVDEHGKPIQKLLRGQTKALNSQRVVYAIGSDDEVRVIRSIFAWYTRDRMSVRGIVKHLTDQNIPAGDRPAWSESMVRRILSDELVLGVYTFNRTTQRLKTKPRKNPPEALIKTKVIDPIIGRAQFESAARRLRIRRHNVPQEENLAAVARLLRAKGFLTCKVIGECPYTPSPETLVEQFGSIYRVYELVGYHPNEHWYSRSERTRFPKEELLRRLRSLYEKHGYVSEDLINGDPSVPSYSTFQFHFGKLTEAYRQAGIPYSITELLRLGYDRFKARNAGKPPRKRGPRTWPGPTSRFSEDDLIGCIRRLHAEHGFVTARLICDDEKSPSVETFRRRFGSLLNAYRHAEIECSRSQIWSRAQHNRAERQIEPAP